jgi:hypothetical protein
MILKITTALIFALTFTVAIAGKCKVEDDFAEISALDADFWVALDAATINAGAFGWSNATIFSNFKNNVLLPHVTCDIKFIIFEAAGPRVIEGIDNFAQFAVDAYARGLRGEFHVSGSLSASCLDRDNYLVEKSDIDFTKTLTSASNIFGRKRAIFTSTRDGLRIKEMNLTIHGLAPLASGFVFPIA